MNIIVEFDDQRILRCADQGRPLVFEIIWKKDGISYPMNHWLDFGAVVMVWWLAATLRILDGANEEEFSFMDGPYSIKVKYHRKSGLVELTPKGTDSIWNISLIELLEELIHTSNQISRELLRIGVGDEDRMSLDQSVAKIRAVMSK